jgi:hypothetical protein
LQRDPRSTNYCAAPLDACGFRWEDANPVDQVA